MADFGAGELDAFRAEVKAWLEASYQAELRAPKVKSAPEAMWGGRTLAGSFAQERSELMVEAMGHQGLGWDGEGYAPGELLAVRGWLRSKGNSIEGGTSEININVVSKRVLGLPDPK